MRSFTANGFIFFCLYPLINTLSIPPQITDSSGEYFIVSSYGSNFTDGNIQCTQPNCHISCDLPKGCFNVAINSSLSSTLTIDCLESKSCEQLTVTDEPSTEANINCYGKSSCSYSSFTLTTTSNVYITCNYPNVTTAYNEDPCYSTTFHVEDADIVLFHSHIYGAQYITIHADNVQTALNITTTGIYALASSTVYASNMNAASAGLLLDCADDGACADTTIYCPYSAKCDINCNKRNGCGSSEFYIQSNEYITNNYFDLYCNESKAENGFLGSCNNVEVFCTEDNDGSWVYTTKLFYNDVNEDYQCLGYGCCPLQFVEPETICTPGRCVILELSSLLLSHKFTL